MTGAHALQRAGAHDDRLRSPAGHREDGDPGIEEVRDFATDLLGAQPTFLQEIGNGNLNRVFRVGVEDTSIVVKQAPPYVWRVGEHMPLTRHRLGIEALAYTVHSKAAPGCLPRLIRYESTRGLLAIEDLLDASDWRTQLLSGEPGLDVASMVGHYLALVCIRTGPLTLSSADASSLHRRFPDASMRTFTERMVFTAPYREDPTNDWPLDLADVAARIRADEAALSKIGYAHWQFRTAVEAVVHGDLHTGSIMVSDSQAPHVIDLEFAFAGPIAFDIGTFAAHLLLARLRRTVGGLDTDAVDDAAATFWSSLHDTLRTLLINGPEREFELHLLADSALFAAAEILRRIGGHFHVQDLTTLAPSLRLDADIRAVNIWASLVRAEPPKSFDEFWALAVDPTKEYL